MATLGTWSFADLTGNSQFTVVGSTLYAVGNTTSAGQFAVYASSDYGITASPTASYTFPESPPNSEFDPAICVDANNLIHIIGTRHNPDNTEDIVKFTFDANTYSAWVQNHVYSIGDKIVDSNGNIQVVTLGGMSGVSAPTWATPADTPAVWQASTTYRLGDTIAEVFGGTTYIWKITTAGKSSGLTPVFNPANSPITDGTVVWLNTGTPFTTDNAVTWDNVTGTGSALGLPSTIVTGEVIGNDYDIVAVSNGTYAVVCSFINSAFVEQVTGYQISLSNQVTGFQTIITSPSRGGETYDSVSLVPPNGVAGTIEAYITHHPKAITYQDLTLTLGLFTMPTIGLGSFIWSSETVLLTLPVRHSDNRLTVVQDGVQRYLSDVYYTQNRAGLSGNMLLGYMPDVTNINSVWNFKQFLGTPTHSLVEPNIAVLSNHDTVLGFITRDLTKNPAMDGLVSVNTLTVSTWAYAPIPDFLNPHPLASWLRGSKTLIPFSMRWGFIGEARNPANMGVSTFYSGFEVAPIAAITPVTVNPALRNSSYLFDASGSFDQNFDAIEYLWTAPYGGRFYPQWQTLHPYLLNAEIVDPLTESVQVVTTPGTSGGPVPFFNSTLGGTTNDGTVVWTCTGTISDTTLTVNPSVPAQAMLFIPNDVGPSAQTLDVQVAVVDLDTHGVPIHFPPTGNQIAFATVDLPFVPLPVITWPGAGGYSPNPVNNVARNSPLTLVPQINFGGSNLTPTYLWSQISGTPMTILGSPLTNLIGPTLTFETNGANVNGDTVQFQIEVNDGVNVPVFGIVTVNIVPYVFNIVDTLTLTRSNWVVATDYDLEPHQILAINSYQITVNNPPTGNEAFLDNGVVYHGGAPLTPVLGPPTTGQYNVNLAGGTYQFALGDNNAHVDISYTIEQQGTISQRNTPQTWTPILPTALFSNVSRVKHCDNLQGEDRMIIISKAGVTVYGDSFAQNSAVLMRRLLIPDTDSGVVSDAVHTEADYTLVLTTSNVLYRYSSAPLINTDNPDVTYPLSDFVTLTAPIPPAWQPTTAYSLGELVLDANGNMQQVVTAGTSQSVAFYTPIGYPTWNVTEFGVTNDGPTLLWKNIGPPVVFNSIFATNTFANVRVIVLSGPDGCFLLQVNSATLAPEAFFEINKASGLLYGADNVQWVRENNLESTHTGEVFIGTLDKYGNTYETLIDLVHRVVLGTWDASQLKNQFVHTGEILFKPESTYVGIPEAPVMNVPVVGSDDTIIVSWEAERPDLITAYNLQYSIDGGVFNPLAYIGSGVTQTFKTLPFTPGHTYAFRVQTFSPDGTSPFSLPSSAYVGTVLPPVVQQIIQVSGGVTGPTPPPAGPFTLVLNWTQNQPIPATVDGYQVQMSVDGGAFSVIANIVGGLNQTFTTVPLASGHAYLFQVATKFNGVLTTTSGQTTIILPLGIPSPPNQVIPSAIHNQAFSYQLLTGLVLSTLDGFDILATGVGPYTWAQTGGTPLGTGSLAGLSLDPSTGLISGVPTTIGVTSGLFFTVTDSASPTPYLAQNTSGFTITIT